MDCHAPGSLTCDDQIGRSDSVEQAHCTLGAVKRCRALSEGGGLPSFWFTTDLQKKKKHYKSAGKEHTGRSTCP